MEHEHPQGAGPATRSYDERWYTPLTRATPLSKYLGLTLFVLLPFIGFMHGFLYDGGVEKILFVEEVSTDAFVRPMSVERGGARAWRQSMHPDATVDCDFLDREYAVSSAEEYTETVTKDFIIALPAGVGIRWVDANGGYYILEDLSSGASATIYTYDYDVDGLIAWKMHSPSLRFEPFTNTWWTMRSVPETPPMRCRAAVVPVTITRDPVYIVSDSDADAFFRSYSVVFESRLMKHEHPYPDSLQFRISGDRSSPDYEDFMEFERKLERIIDTVRPIASAR